MVASYDAPASDQRVQLSRGASYLVIQNLGSSAVTIVAFIVLARLISPAEMGIWTILLLVTATCQTFVTLSIDQAVTKFVAENMSKGMKSIASAVFYKGLLTTALTGLPVVIAVYYGAPFLSIHLLGDASRAALFQVLAVDVFFFVGALPVLGSALLGLQKFRQVAIVGLTIGGVLRQALIIGLIILLHNFVGLVVGWVISDAATVAVYFLIVVRALGPPTFNFPVAKLFRFSLPLTLASIAGFAQAWFDRALLAVFVPLALLGIYNAALTAFGVVQGVSGAMGSMLFPAYSFMQGRQETGRSMRDAIRLATRYSSFTLIPLALGLFATAKPSITLFVGVTYLAGYVPLMVLCLAFAITAFTTALSPVFLAIGETKVAASITAVSVVLALVVAYLILPFAGIVGASAARALSMIVVAGLTIIVLRRKKVLQFDVDALVKNLLAGFVMAVVVIAIQLVSYSRLMLPLYVIVGASVYMLMLRILKAVNPADIDLLQRFLGRRLSLIGKLLSWVLI